MKAIAIASFAVILASALCAQAPSLVQSNVTPPSDGRVPIYSVEVTSRSIRAVNYRNSSRVCGTAVAEIL
jgi:hypothetical protein